MFTKEFHNCCCFWVSDHSRLAWTRLQCKMKYWFAKSSPPPEKQLLCNHSLTKNDFKNLIGSFQDTHGELNGWPSITARGWSQLLELWPCEVHAIRTTHKFTLFHEYCKYIHTHLSKHTDAPAFARTSITLTRVHTHIFTSTNSKFPPTSTHYHPHNYTS